MESFRTSNGASLIRDLLSLQRSSILENTRKLSPTLREFFNSNIDAVISRGEVLHRGVLGTRSLGSKMTIEIEVPSDADLWAAALSDVLDDANIDAELVGIIGAPTQAVVATTLARTLIALGAEPTTAHTQTAARTSRNLATLVTRINDTTRNLISNELNAAIDEGLTVAETVKQLRNRLPDKLHNRIPTITRTELGRAADEGVKEAYRQSQVVTHVSVVGCEAVEPSSPSFDGEPTCNIRNVPLWRVNELEFHINHTGAIVSTGFYHADGSVPTFRVQGEEFTE